jgi:hypothetical protein
MMAEELAANTTGAEQILPAHEWHFEYSSFSSTGWKSPSHAVLQHLMLLRRIAKLGPHAAAQAYRFPFWDFDAQGYGTRWSINAFAYMLSDLEALDFKACNAVQDDEAYLTTMYPSFVDRHTFATGDALVAHFAYFTQRSVMERYPWLLERYAALARTLDDKSRGEPADTEKS